MKRGGPLKRSDKQMDPGGLPRPTKAQAAVFDALIEQIGCAVCRFHMGVEGSEGEIHHLLEGQRRISHDYVIPLCAVHHRQGVQEHPSRHSVNGCHGGLHVFEQTYGDEYSLLDKCEGWINQRYATGAADEQAAQCDDRTTDTHADMEPDPGDEPLGAQTAARFDSPVHIHCLHYRYRLADSDGPSIKAAVDGFVKAGVLADDSAKEVEEIRHRQVKIPRSEKERTIFTITEMSA